jgi:glycosyltransferase involved in cell wall biosynthesis
MPLHMAGTELYVHSLATLQQKTGHMVTVVTPYFEYKQSGKYEPSYVYDGITVQQYMEVADPTDRQIIRGHKKPAGLQQFDVLLQTLKPDVVHFHELTRSIGLCVDHVRAAKNAGAKTLLTMHLSGYTCSTNNLVVNNKLCEGKINVFDCSVCSFKTHFKIPSWVVTSASVAGIALNKLNLSKKLPENKLGTLFYMPANIERIRRELQVLIENVDHFVSITEWYKKILIKNGVPEGKIEVIKQALAAPGNIAEKQIKDQLPVKVIFIGRIQPEKGIHLLIEAFKNFNEKEAELHIYGKKEETDYCKMCIQKSSGSSNIFWRGVIKREDVLPELSKYNILCLPSTFSEMSPLVIQEAFATGTPVLASRVYGNEEHVKHEVNGLLFDYKSAADLTNQLRRLVANPTLLTEFKKNIHIPNRFDKVNDRYLELYSGVNYTEY